MILGYYYLKIPKQWLVLSSLFFYGYWNPKYIILILISILVNYAFSISLTKKQSKTVFVTSLVFNLGLLGFFKYFDFFIENINHLASTNFNLLHIILPLGISFFTLQQVAFLVDTYEGITKSKKLIDYSLFVSFFPQLIAGPIVHYSEVMPQIEDEKNRKFNHSNFSKGIYVFCIGLFKKVIIADSFSFYVNESFLNLDTLHFFSAWGTSLSYTMQLYFDFSGYSDMAIGLGLLFNIKLPENFNSPLKSKNIVEFWSRWHITLTNFITTYVFTPLVRSMPQINFSYMMLSSFLAMIVAGIWHGAAWTFVLYGVLHGGAIVVNHMWKKTKIKLPTWLAWLLAFNYINMCFLVFRAKTIDQSLLILKNMYGFGEFKISKGLIRDTFFEKIDLKLLPNMSSNDNLVVLGLFICLIFVLKAKNSMQAMEDFKGAEKEACLVGFMFVMCIFGLNRLTEFIYFNF